jgi:uncharacterized protein (TIGR03382 family)
MGCGTHDGPVYLALVLAAAAAMLSEPPRPRDAHPGVQSLLLARVAPAADALAGAISDKPEMIAAP